MLNIIHRKQEKDNRQAGLLGYAFLLSFGSNGNNLSLHEQIPLPYNFTRWSELDAFQAAQRRVDAHTQALDHALAGHSHRFEAGEVIGIEVLF